MIDNKFKILQWNARSISQNFNEFQILIKKQDPDIICLQETNLNSKNKLKIPGYHPPARLDVDQIKNTAKIGRGLLITTKLSYSFETIQAHSDEHHEELTILAHLSEYESVKITNTYVYCNSPVESKWDNLETMLTRQDLENHIITGDFNLHHPSWEPRRSSGPTTKLSDPVSNKLHQFITHNLLLHNSGENTYEKGNAKSAIDLTLSHPSPNLNNLTWTVSEDNHDSDHYPIMHTWSFSKPSHYVPPIGELRFKTAKADWVKFENEACKVNWRECRNSDPAIHAENLQKAVIEVAKSSIPHTDPSKPGKIHSKASRTVPWWTKECQEARDNKIKARKTWKLTKQESHRQLYSKLKGECNKVMNKAKKISWNNYTNNLNEHTNATQMWKTIHAMEGTRPSGNNIHPLTTEDGSKTTSHKEIANTLSKQYFNISSNNNNSPALEDKLREMAAADPGHKKLKGKKKTYSEKVKAKEETSPYNAPIQLAELEAVLRSKGHSAPGLDILQYEVYNHLPPSAKTEILVLFNTIWENGSIPQDFKHAVIIPILKPGKESDKASSYRPISLTSHLGKTLEAIVTNRLTTYLLKENKLKNNQSGFLPNRQTHDHLLRLVNEVEKCKSLHKTTAAVFLDLEKAFDTMNRELCLKEVFSKGITGNLFNYIADYLKDRTFQVKVGNSLSDPQTQEQGVPQGGIISPILFNIALDAIGDITEKFPKVDSGQFADDNSSWLLATKAPFLGRPILGGPEKAMIDIKTKLEPVINHMMTELESHGFKVNVNKTQIIVFNCNLEVTLTLQNQQVTSQKSVRYLGITLDKNLTFKEHIENKVVQGKKALNILKCLGKGKFGLTPKNRIKILKGYVLAKMRYGEEIYYNAHKQPLNQLQLIVNEGLRQVLNTGKNAPILGLSALANLPPLDLQREERLAHLWLRIAHNPKNPTNKIYNKRLYVRKGQKLPITNSTQNILLEIGLNSDSITKVDTHLNWEHEPLIIDTSLTKKISKKTTPMEVMQKITSEYLDTEYRNLPKIYTDGSKKGERVGAGVYCDSGGSHTKHRLTNNTAILSAEMTALEQALLHVQLHHKADPKVVIVSDSKSSLDSLKNPLSKKSSRPDLNQKIYNRNDEIYPDTKVSMVWSPSHIGLDGNDQADAAANLAADKDKIDIDIKLGPTEARSLIKGHYKAKFNNWYVNSDKTVQTRQLIPSAHTKVDISKSESKINCLRLNAPRFRFPRRVCELCQRPLSIRHVLTECYHFITERSLVETEFRKINKNSNPLIVHELLDINLKGEAKIRVKQLVQAIDKVFYI